MHSCLSCDQPCSPSSIFCDACRLSLLKRSTAEQEKQEEGAEEKNASSVGDVVDLVSAPQLEVVESAPTRQTEAGNLLTSWATSSGAHSVETLGPEKVATAVVAAGQSAGVLVSAAPSTRRPMPRRVRRALTVFCIVGVLALSIDGILLALSIIRHHTQGQGATQVDSASVANRFGLTPENTPTSVANSGNVLSLSSTRLFFTAMQGQKNPASQSMVLSTGGKQAFSWQLVPSSLFPAWLHLSTMQGRTTGRASAQVTVSIQAAQLPPGTYTASLLVKAFDHQGKALLNTPQTFGITLTVQVPCALNVTPSKLSFAAVLLSPPAPETLTVTESGDCARPVNWQASADAPWVTFSSSSGVDTGAGSIIIVQASSSGKIIGTYTAHITLVATDSRGEALAGSPVTIAVTLTVLA
ncbi:MAG TPA: hypothetical protein VFV38_38100 [Ktedonobacteraceae bacterium]|nr:hypothetical protein [Ktedonobacteraceae bacterium]